MHSRLPSSNVLPREAGNDLTEFMEVGAFKSHLVEALPDWVPCRTAVHQCTQVPFPVGAHCCSRNQEFGAWADQRTAKEFMPRQLLSSFNDFVLSLPGPQRVRRCADDRRFGHGHVDERSVDAG